MDDWAHCLGWGEDLRPRFIRQEVWHLVFWCVGVEYGKLDLICGAFFICAVVGIGLAVDTVVCAVGVAFRVTMFSSTGTASVLHFCAVPGHVTPSLAFETS